MYIRKESSFLISFLEWLASIGLVRFFASLLALRGLGYLVYILYVLWLFAFC